MAVEWGGDENSCPHKSTYARSRKILGFLILWRECANPICKARLRTRVTRGKTK